MHADPFDRLGLPPKFDLDAAQIRRAFLAKVQEAHPDLAAAPAPVAGLPPESSPLDPAGSLDPSAMLNHALRTLQNPESRAEALLARLGGPSPSADKSLPPGFLAEIMDTREQIEAALAEHDPAQRDHWESWANTRREQHARTVSELFKQHAADPSPDTLSAVRQELNVWRYTERLLEQFND